jgi:3-deoxy-7-phosphoheptulonate synthase/chorismate mutase
VTVVAVEDYRARIDELDGRLVATFNERLEVVAALVAHKRTNGVALRDPQREQMLLERLASANGGPLSPAGLERLVRFVLDLTKEELDV